MTDEPEHKIILKDDGFPVTALLEGVKAVTVHPQNSGAWVCMQLHTHAHEEPAVQDRYSEFLPPEKFQLALDPMTAHQLGLYLIEKAKAAVEP